MVQYTAGDDGRPAEPEVANRLLLRWYSSEARDLPWRRTRDPYAILVSEVMLQQTQAERVAPKYEEFLTRFPSFEALADAGVAEVIRAWAPLGYNRRAVNLHRLARAVQEEHGGRLPDDPATLRALPGVGRYTAAAIACFAFGRSEPVVDTNIRRVLGRLSDRIGLKPAEQEDLARRYLPMEQAADWNQALMDIGATLCTSLAPSCLLCPLSSICPSRGRVVRERRAAYGARRNAKPFIESDRYLRGRIVALLRALPPGESARFGSVLAALGMSVEENERLRRLLRALSADGLLALDERTDGIALPAL